MQSVLPDDLRAADLRALFWTFLEQHLGESQDGAHGRADLVTHVRQEFAFGLAGRLGGLPGFCQFALGLLPFA